jgi:HEAT repeat protein
MMLLSLLCLALPAGVPEESLGLQQASARQEEIDKIEAGAALELLLASSEERDPIAVRSWRPALMAVQAFDKGRFAVPALVEELKNGLVSRSMLTAYALYSLGPHDEVTVRDLVDVLKSKDSTRRGAAALALASSGANATHALAPLRQLLEDPVPTTRVRAAATLSKIVPTQNKRSLSVLLNQLGPRPAGKEADVEFIHLQEEVLQAVGGMGASAITAISRLLPLLDSAEYRIQTAAAIALIQIDPKQEKALVIISDRIERRELAEAHDRIRAIQVLATIETHRGRAISAAKEMVRSDNATVCYYGVNCLSWLPLDKAEKVALLVESMKGTNAQIRQLAAFQLGAMGRDALAALPELKRWENDEDRFVRLQVRAAIKSIQGK